MSPFMLYSMARRYDEFPGREAEDRAPACAARMKGWYKHGACAASLWRDDSTMPRAPPKTPTSDWWLDAAQRPLGAYYRVDTRSVTDMHVALNEVGVLYASARLPRRLGPRLNRPADGAKTSGRFPRRGREPDDGGHAFAIVGYDRAGLPRPELVGQRLGRRRARAS